MCAVSDTTDEDRASICWAVRHTVTLAAESCLTNDTLTTFSSSSDGYDDSRYKLGIPDTLIDGFAPNDPGN